MNRSPLLYLVAISICTISWAAIGSAQDPVSFELVSSKATAKPGSTFRVAVKADIASGWHIYWSNPGETGLPTLVEWKIPEELSISSTKYPVPNRYSQKITESLTLVSHTFEGEAYFISEVTIPGTISPGTEIMITADVQWQACKEICTPPMTSTVSLSVPVATESSNSSTADAITQAWNKGQGSAPMLTVEASISGGLLHINGTLPENGRIPGPGSWYLPSIPDLVAAQQQQTIKISDNRLSITIPVEDGTVIPEPLSGFLLGTDGTATWLTTSTEEIPAPTEEHHEKGLLLFLLLALAGGVILNLMPCVFPILGIKIMGFVKQAGDDKASIRKHGWAFTFGVIISLWLLVGILFIVRHYGNSAGWGFQLQEPGFIIFMIFLMFVFALNLSGLFELGTSLIGVGSGLQSKEGLGGAFFSGVLAVLVATPCTGPFMAPALGYALSKPYPIAMLVFTMLAIGLALPYLLLSYFPALIQKLPRPGPWMETFKQTMAFPMYATVIWLLWIFSAQTNHGAVTMILSAMLIGALGLWLYGKYTTPVTKIAAKRSAQTVSAILIGIMIWLGTIASKETPEIPEGTTVKKYGIEWEVFDTGRIVDLREQGKTIFLDFTAKW